MHVYMTAHTEDQAKAMSLRTIGYVKVIGTEFYYYQGRKLTITYTYIDEK